MRFFFSLKVACNGKALAGEEKKVEERSKE
jgi:hypothetical protein